jgi:hypothetical protein
LVGIVAWSSLAFTVSDYFHLTLMVAVCAAMVPSAILLAVLVPGLAAEFNKRTVVLTRRGSQSAVGAAGPFAPEQFSIAMAQAKRWGKRVCIVTLTVRTVVIKTAVEMEVLARARGASRRWTPCLKSRALPLHPPPVANPSQSAGASYITRARTSLDVCRAADCRSARIADRNEEDYCSKQ